MKHLHEAERKLKEELARVGETFIMFFFVLINEHCTTAQSEMQQTCYDVDMYVTVLFFV